MVSLSFNSKTVLTLKPETGSPQLNHAIEFCNNWLNGKQAFSFHTSGSTGTPKHILLQRTQLEASAMATIDALRLTANEKIYVCLNTQLIAGTMMLVRGMMLGCEIFVDEPTSDPLNHISANHDFTFASFVPMQFHALLTSSENEMEKLNRFQHILIGGAAINAALEKKIGELKCNVFHTYGMTETVSHIALRKIGIETFYTALEGVQLKTDERGCLCICSASTNSEWIVTNDLVDLFAPNKFKLLGRADEVINSGGIKIFPSKVEEALHESMQDLDVNDYFVGAEEDEKLGQKLICVVRGNPFTAKQEEKIKETLMRKLSRFEIPSQYYFVDFFELTPSGKTDKYATINLLKN